MMICEKSMQKGVLFVHTEGLASSGSAQAPAAAGAADTCARCRAMRTRTLSAATSAQHRQPIGCTGYAEVSADAVLEPETRFGDQRSSSIRDDEQQLTMAGVEPTGCLVSG